eukprot:c13647_g1_i3.p2 GENE.c13647_g1_i3~~c13647_g1_i3.p2  ORF type:complete len:104 (+),score=23.23 c13647_g1_i3:290-601(+)
MQHQTSNHSTGNRRAYQECPGRSFTLTMSCPSIGSVNIRLYLPSCILPWGSNSNALSTSANTIFISIIARSFCSNQRNKQNRKQKTLSVCLLFAIAGWVVNQN